MTHEGKQIMSNETSTQDDSYVYRNSRWLMPAVATIIIVTTQQLITALGGQPLLANWLIVAIAVVGIGWTALNCWKTDSVSATVVLLFLKAASVAAILTVVWQAWVQD
jgi:hypothetical protein